MDKSTTSYFPIPVNVVVLGTHSGTTRTTETPFRKLSSRKYLLCKTKFTKFKVDGGRLQTVVQTTHNHHWKKQ